MRAGFSGRAFDYQTLRTMAYTTFGGASPWSSRRSCRRPSCSASAYENPRLAEAVLRAPDVLVDGLASLGARFSLEARWLMGNSRWVFGVDSAAELGRTLREYSLSGVASRIECPVLVLAGEDDHFVPLGLPGSSSTN